MIVALNEIGIHLTSLIRPAVAELSYITPSIKGQKLSITGKNV